MTEPAVHSTDAALSLMASILALTYSVEPLVVPWLHESLDSLLSDAREVLR